MQEHQEILSSLTADLKPKVGESAWRDWFANATISYKDGYHINFPNDFVSNWVKSKYFDVIKNAATKIGIDLQITSNATDAIQHSIQLVKKFTSNFTFDNFIVGKPNVIAYEAAKKIAFDTSISFNPLFIHSPVGLGKTHLLHAIVQQRTKLFPNDKVLYLSAEQFMNRFVNEVIHKKNAAGFKEELRSVDVLLIDDFQFLGSKGATQEEFFHTFNALLENGKQLVITADEDPTSLPGVELRLKSRLGWGLVVNIHQPSYELKLGILQNKLAMMQCSNASMTHVSTDIIEYIAIQSTNSIRELEGSLLKIVKHAEWTKTCLTLELAQTILKPLPKQENPITKLNKLCQFLNVDLTQIQGNSRMRPIVRARQKIVYILRHNLRLSYPKIAEMLGNKDHTSIMYAEKQAKSLQNEDASFAQDLKKLGDLV
jgi:chromosomal replication initiator protein